MVPSIRTRPRFPTISLSHQEASTSLLSLSIRGQIEWKPQSQRTNQSDHHMDHSLSNSMKLSHACGATQDGRVMVERSDRMWSTGEGNGKRLQYSCLGNPMNSMKRQNDRILKEELPRYTTSFTENLPNLVPYLTAYLTWIFLSFFHLLF